MAEECNTSKTVVVSFRLTPAQTAHIDAAVLGGKIRRTRSDWCRAVALYVAKQKVPEPVKPRRKPARRKPAADIEALARILGRIGKIGGNINQLARHANQGGDLPSKKALAEIADKIDQIRRTVQSVLAGKEGGDGH